jgi:AcrR family transcriptional regulator
MRTVSPLSYHRSTKRTDGPLTILLTVLTHGPPDPDSPRVPASHASLPIALPLLGDRPERGDAAANRQRILTAARALLDAHGPSGVSMDAVAAAAGVGKGTVFRRFGDRPGLMSELISDYMRHFQDAFLCGPPPLGPGAPPTERLVAFITAMISLQRSHLPVALAVELSPADTPDRVYGVLRLHASALIHDIDPALDADVLAVMILGAVAPPVLSRLDADSDAIVAAMTKLLRGITGPKPVRRRGR